MWRRVLLVLVIYSTIAVIGLAVPLAVTLSRERLQRFGENRFAAASHFASLAARQDYFHDTDLQQALDRYYALYGEPVVIVDRTGAPRASAGAGMSSDDVDNAVSEALRNQRSRVPDTLTPWSPAQMLIAVPVGTGTQVDGAVVLAASTAAAKGDVTRAWLLIVAGAVALLAVASSIAFTLSRWTVRPLTELSARVSSLGHRVLDHTPAGDADADRSTGTGGRYAGPQEVRRLSAVFDAMARDVEAAAVAQRRLVADSAHALRNPLAALRIRLDTLGMALPESSAAAHHKATVEVDRLEGIVADLLALATAETRPDRDSESPVTDVGAVIADRHEFWAAALTEAGIASGNQTSHDGALCAAIPESDLTQILDIVLSNALHYAGAGSRVDLGARRSGADVAVWVQDDGRGVSDADLPMIATRFFRAANTVGHGTGLGLSIARALAERCGGAFDVGAGSSGGLRVSLRLPAADRAEQDSS